MNTNVGTIAATLATAVIIPVLSVLAAYLIAYIKKRTLELETNIKQKYTQSQINAAEDVINTAVIAISQTYVSQIKKGGLFNQLEKTKAYELAKQKVYSILSDESIEILNQVHKDVDAWIESKIEYYVNMDNCIKSNESTGNANATASDSNAANNSTQDAGLKGSGQLNNATGEESYSGSKPDVEAAVAIPSSVNKEESNQT